MSADTLKIGHLIGTEQSRDAIHVAVVPVIVGKDQLSPGCRVGLDKNGHASVLLKGIKYVGIIDPFLTVWVQPGQTCWLFLPPGSITSLRHQWTHPAFDALPAVTAVEPEESESDHYVVPRIDRTAGRAKAAPPGPTAAELEAMANAKRIAPSEKWIKEYADEIGVSYHDLLSAASDHLQTGSYLCRGGLLDGVYTSDQFWEHYAIVTGTEVPEDERDNFFTCSC